MANAGLTVYGDSGIFQIDNTYKNLVLREKGTLVTDSTLYNGGTGNVVTYKSIGLRGGFTSPVICVGGNVLAQPEQQWSGSQVGFVVSASGPIGTSVPYWIFDVPTPSPSSGFGLNVWDSAGNLIFNTDSPPMRVVNFAANNDNPNWTGTAGRSYAVAHVVRGYRQVSVEGQFIRGTFTQVNGANVTGTYVQVAATSGTPSTMIKQLTSIILDVTNY